MRTDDGLGRRRLSGSFVAAAAAVAAIATGAAWRSGVYIVVIRRSLDC